MVGIIDAHDPIFLNMYNEYCTPKPFELSRLKTDFITEIKTRDEYQGREIYELIQNADDQDATILKVSLNTKDKSLTIVNNGDKPFSKEGYCSIMLPDSSPKVFEKLIGQKGLGFRAILNWADSVEIVSNGVRCLFSPEVAAENWDKIQKVLDPGVVEKLNKLARKKRKKCPVPMLAIPRVTAQETGEDIAAIISIHYKDNAEEGIREQLKKLSPKILLFLRKLERIEISIDGELKFLNRGETKVDGHVFHTFLGEDEPTEEWISISKEGRLYEDNEDSNYQVSIAYKYGGIGEDQNFLYSFFPTRIQNPYNCIIHATFELNQSRKEILDNETNHELFGIVANTMLELAEHLAEGSHSINWEPFSVVSPSKGREHIAAIGDTIQDKVDSLAIYPSVKGEYINLHDADYISSKMSQLIQTVRGLKPKIDLFPHHLVEVPENVSFDITGCDDFFNQLNNLSENIDDIDLRTDLLYELSHNQFCISAIKDSGSFPHLLVDDQNQIILDKGYFNTGDRIPNIPDFIDFHYVNDNLAERIKNRFGVSNVRYLCDSSALRNLVDINYCDKNTVIARVLPTTAADVITVKQRIKCLYEYYQQTGDVASSTQADRVKLPNAANEMVSADELVLWENSYPDGVEKLDIQIDDKWKLAGPEYWGLEIDDWPQFEKFWTSIGVSIYTPKERKCISDDTDYLSTNDIQCREIQYYQNWRTDPKNNVRVPVKEYLDKLCLEDVLSVLALDVDTRDAIVRNEEHKYYYNKRVFSKLFKSSYCSYYLRRETEPIKGLEGYVISADMSPNGITLDYDVFKNRKLTAREIHTMISHLGAVEKAEDLSQEQLYNILLAQPVKNPDGTRIAKIYNAVKKALISKDENGESLSIPPHLKLFARRLGETKGNYYPRNQVYYWDNDSFPKQFLKDKPKLEIGHRVGEDQVKKTYGIKLPKDNTIEIVENLSERNIYFEGRLCQYIQDRVKFILAFRVEDIKNGEALTSARNALEKLTIHCYKSCKVTSNDGADPVEIGDYEMIVTKDDKKKMVFNIRYSKTDVESAFRIPEFCAAITEAIAITLKLKTENTEFIDAVTTILVGDASMNEYFVKRKFGEDADNIINRFGEKKRKTVGKKSDRYNDLLQLRERYINNYSSYIYEQVKGSVETQKTFKSVIRKFYLEDEWIKELAKRISPKADILAAFDNTLIDNFGVSLLDLDTYDGQKIVLCEEYPSDIRELCHLSDEEVSIMFFHGNDELVAQIREKYLPKENQDEDEELEVKEAAQKDLKVENMHGASWADNPHERIYSTSPSDFSHKPKHRKHLTSRQAKQIGDEATDIVIESMRSQPELYGTVRRIDENGDKLLGTDSLHYDVEYVDMLTNTKRFLEVKSIEGNECQLTPMEYKTGKDNPEEYDIAFVRDGKPYLFKKPFTDKRFQECIWPTEYTINLVNLKLDDK